MYQMQTKISKMHMIKGRRGTSSVNREFKQISKACATTAAVTKKAWREYVSVVCLILAKRDTKMPEA